MRKCRSAVAVATISLISIIASITSQGTDWPRFNGPGTEGQLPEAFDLQQAAQAGLKQQWARPIGGGYAGPAVAGGIVVVTDFLKQSGELTNNAGTRDQLLGQERVLAFDANDGRPLWTYAQDQAVAVSFAAGPRATPAIDTSTNTVVSLGTEGTLSALSLSDGSLKWQRDLKEFGGQTPIWGYASSPLITGGKVITLAGGPDHLVVALDLASGEVIWHKLTNEEIGYCPPTLLKRGGDELVVVWEPGGIHALNPSDGSEVWSTPLNPSYGMAISPPLVHEDRMYVSGIGERSVMLRLSDDGRSVERLWEGTPKTAAYFSNAAGQFTDNLVVGADCGSGNLIGFDPENGQRYFETMKPTSGTERRASHGTAFIFAGSDDRYALMSETGDFIVAKITPSGYEELYRQAMIEPTNFWQDREVVWSYPAFVEDRIYVRNDKELACFQIAPQN